MNRFLLILVSISIIGCRDYPQIYRDYYPSGDVKLIKEFSSKNSYCETLYYLNGNTQRKMCVQNGLFEGKGLEYYESGELYSTMNFRDDMMDGITEFYYKDGSLKAINLFSNDSLYYVKSITKDKRDTIDRIIPIITISSEKIVDIDVAIPFTDEFKYKDENIVIHYDIVILEEGKGYPLPRENKIMLNKGRNSKTIHFIPEKTGLFTFQGLITIGNERLMNYDQNFFQRSFRVAGQVRKNNE